ncbi:hypothetical protein KBD59_00565 [Candidatus Gracilibacteria bacterium]|nr:hypothetical protein [Candidatus Gracilibacteria bacterium]
MLITLYGINNIGKTTHAQRLVKRLKKNGVDAVYIKYPVYDIKPTGPLINKILRSSKKQQLSEYELQLLFVLNRYQFQPTLEKLLKKGTVVIAEDYCGTGIAWGHAKGAKLKELQLMNTFLVQEDLAILMQGKRHTSAKETKHLHEQNDQLVAKVGATLKKLARLYKWKTVEVADDPEVTHERLYNVIKMAIK